MPSEVKDNNERAIGKGVTYDIALHCLVIKGPWLS